MTVSLVLRRTLRLGALALAFPASAILGLFAAIGFKQWGLLAWSRVVAAAMGLRSRCRKAELPQGCLVASNHVGYLDALVLGSFLPVRFLAKSEIADWPLLGLLVRLSGAVFVERERPRSVSGVVKAVAIHLTAGDRILLFPEAGVSSDGVTLGEFKPMIFQACIDTGRPVVPVAVRYVSPPEPRVWAWIEEPSLWRHAWTRVFVAPGGIKAELLVGDVLWPSPGEGRKELAARTRRAVETLLEGVPRA